MRYDPTQPVYVPSYVFAALSERIEAVSKKARRLGTPEPTLTVIERITRRETSESGITRNVAYVGFTLEATTPALDGGWKLVAAIEHYEIGNIVRVAPEFHGEALDLNGVDSICDHCGTKRSRKMTLLVQDEHGARKRVGSACVKDYLGHEIPSVWTIWAMLDDVRADIDEDRIAGGKHLNVEAACILAAHLTRTVGFVKSSEGYSTRDRVAHALAGMHSDDPIIPDADAERLAQDAIDWLQSNDDNSEYLMNLRVALEVADPKHLGLIASLPAAYLRARDKADAAAKVAEIPTTPCVLGKTTVTGQVVKAYTHYTDFGPREVMVVRDDRGFSVWGTKPSNLTVAVGDTVRFDATIEPSEKPDFGFYKRPSKATVLAIQPN